MSGLLNKSKSLFKNINLLNVLLAAVLVLVADYAVLPFTSANIKYVLPAPKKAVEKKEEKPAEHSPPSPSDYIIVSEENLFHPDRKIPAEKKAEEAPLPKPEIVLYGTLIAGDTRLAYLEDLKSPRSTLGRGKRQITLKIGDTLSGFTLKEIDPDKIVMARGEEKIIVHVLEPGKPKAREGAAPAVQTARGQPYQAPQGTPQWTPPVASSQRPPLPRPLFQPPPTSKTVAPMTPADARARQFFTK
jgi:hypothetical protein